MNDLQNDVKVLSSSDDYSFVDEWYNIASEEHFWMQWRFLALTDLLKDARLPLAERLYGIDIGCGKGILRDQLESKTDWIIDGADLLLNGLQNSKRGRGKFYLYNVKDRHKDLEKRYDFMVLFDILEHIEDAGAFIGDCRFHLKENGYFFVNVPAVPFLFGPYDRAAGHLRRYTAQTLRKLLESCGLKIVGMRYWGLSMLPFLFLRNVITNPNLEKGKIIERGFRPPNKLTHALLKGLMRIENACVKKPWLGTSLVAVARCGI